MILPVTWWRIGSGSSIPQMIFGRVEYRGMATPNTNQLKDFIFVPNADGSAYETAINAAAITHIGYRPDGGVSVVLGPNAVSFESGSEGAKIFTEAQPEPPAKKEPPAKDPAPSHGLTQHGPVQPPETPSKHKS